MVEINSRGKRVVEREKSCEHEGTGDVVGVSGGCDR